MNYSYVIVKFKKPDKLIPALKDLSKNPSVKEWDAVEGHVNLVIKSEKSPASILNQIKMIEGFEKYDIYNVNQECRQAKERDNRLSYAYLFIEIDQKKSEQIKKLLIDWEIVYRCESIGNGCDFLVLVGAETIGQIDTAIKNTLYEADGILRFKRADVINLENI